MHITEWTDLLLLSLDKGENLSPLLFAIYLNDFQEFVSRHYNGLNSLTVDTLDTLEICYLKLYVLLYADDTKILAETATDLQCALNALQEYCHLWKLTVNVVKTKSVIFSRGKIRQDYNFTYEGSRVDIVDSFSASLGVDFNYHGKFKKGINKQISQARKALDLKHEDKSQGTPPQD